MSELVANVKRMTTNRQVPEQEETPSFQWRWCMAMETDEYGTHLLVFSGRPGDYQVCSTAAGVTYVNPNWAGICLGSFCILDDDKSLAKRTDQIILTEEQMVQLFQYAKEHFGAN